MAANDAWAPKPARDLVKKARAETQTRIATTVSPSKGSGFRKFVCGLRNVSDGSADRFTG